jgi:hypothetical protein
MRLRDSTKRNVRMLAWGFVTLLVLLFGAMLFQMLAYAKTKSYSGVDMASVSIAFYESGFTLIFVVISVVVSWLVRGIEIKSGEWRYFIEDLDVEGIDQAIIMLEKHKRRLEIERDVVSKYKGGGRE